MTGPLRTARRAARRGLTGLQLVVESAVDLLRRGERTVLCPPLAGMRLGNLLYLWLNAHHRTASGGSVLVRASRGAADWCREFPALDPYTVSGAEMRFSDRREWDSSWLYQRFGTDFSREQLHAFIQAVFGDRTPADPGGRLVINVRRGDFYGTPFEAKHGFEIVPYVESALRLFDRGESVLVVSDDPAWCREHLAGVLAARASDVEYAEPDAVGNLLALGQADKLIGANSTFSYWGAYIADALHDGAQIVMPRFHARMAHGTDAYQLDPRWTALEGFH